MAKDACYRKVMASYGKWSARAAQATAKCRKKSGKACGAGGANEYCRPSKRVSSKTPKTRGEMTSGELARKKAEKSRVGMQGAFGKKVSPIRRLRRLGNG